MNSRLSPSPVTPNIFSGLLFLLLILCLAPALAVAAERQGVLEVRLKDHREAIGDFSKLTVTVGEILISPKPGLKFWQRGWKALPVAPQVVDLTQYIGANSAQIFRGNVDARAFDAIHLKLKEVNGVLKKSQRKAHIKNTVGPIKLSFEVRAQGETKIVLDLVVMDMSDHPPQGYELAVRGYELYTNGRLIDKIPPGS
jgi:Domain of unknown function (DUF4382)